MNLRPLSIIASTAARSKYISRRKNDLPHQRPVALRWFDPRPYAVDTFADANRAASRRRRTCSFSRMRWT